jgi:hypothetical protein
MYVKQTTGYRAFIPTPLPPKPAVKIERELQNLLSIAQIAEGFAVSYQAASTIVAQLEKVQILRETTGRKRDKRYVYSDYLNILAEGTKI